MPGYSGSSGGIPNSATYGSGGSGTGDAPPGYSPGVAGCVIVSIPSTFSVTTSGTSNIGTSGGNTIYTWSGAGNTGYIQF
jgi:hypothetical protein